MVDDLTGTAAYRRRDILAGAGAALLATPALAADARAVELVTGGYAREGNPGVLPLHYQPGPERWERGSAAADAPDASFGVVHPRFGLLYVVEEGTAGMIAALRRGADGRWQRVARLPSLGADPCHLALDPSGLFLAVANYSSGSVGLFALDRRSGLPLGPGERRDHHGSGPHPDRQRSAHAHWAGFTPDGRWLHAVDLGADAIFAYPFDARTGRLGQATVAYKAEAGTGPRHLARHPRLPCAYVVDELANRVTSLRMVGPERFERAGDMSTLPPGFAGPNTAAEIAIDRAGRRLYVSNRGHDSIAVFAVGRDGGLTAMQHVPSGGRGPRHFLLLEAEARMVVANENSGTLATLRIGSDGRLAAHGAGLAVPGVTFSARLRG